MIPPLAFHATAIENKLVMNANVRMEPMTMEKIILVLNAIFLGIFIILDLILVRIKMEILTVALGHLQTNANYAIIMIIENLLIMNANAKKDILKLV